jgi:uncharacterized protein YukE
MVRIRVNIEDLKENAKDFDSVSGAVNRAGDDILAVAMAMPSYDGQLFSPARKVGYEIQTQCWELKAALSSNAESLRKAAQAFEEVDNEVITTIGLEQATITDQAQYFLATYGVDQGGNTKFGFESLGDDYMVVWYSGYYLRMKYKVPPMSQETYDKATKLIDSIKAFDKALQGVPEVMQNVFEESMWSIAKLLILAATGGAAGALAGAKAALALQTLIGAYVDYADTFTTLYNEMQDIANEYVDLFMTDDPAIDTRTYPQTP